MKLIFYRIQTVEVSLKREPTEKEKAILRGEDVDSELTMFDLDDLIDWDTEEVVNEDYSNDVWQHIPFNKILKK
jgi:hypothetical protein